MATIAQIKAGLNIVTLNLQRANNKEGQPTEWLRHWDNDRRIAVSIHQDTLDFAKENPNDAQFITQHEDRESAAGGGYSSYRIVKVSAEIEDTL
jgi:hypothetical protein